jgi:hypothetical protein
MNMTKTGILCCLLVLASFALCGCGKKADENKPVGEVKAEAEKMSIEKLKSTAMAYKEAITAKKGEVEKIASKLKDIPLTKMVGDEAKGLKADIDGLNKSISALKSRFEVYYNKLKEKGGDLSSLSI